MKLMVRYATPTGADLSKIDKVFAERPPAPASVKLLGRWHGVDGQGVAIFEVDDEKIVYSWYRRWAGLIQWTAVPCVDDAGLADVLAAEKKG